MGCRGAGRGAWLLIAAAIWLLASGFARALLADQVEAWLYLALRTGFLACLGLAALWPPPQRLGADGELDRGPWVWPFGVIVLLVPAGLLIQAVGSYALGSGFTWTFN